MKKFLIVMLVASGVYAAAPANTVPTSDFAFALDHQFSNAAAAKLSLGTRVYRSHTTAFGVLDIAAQSGANGDYTVGIQLPAKAILRQVFFDTITAVAPAGTSIAWKLLTSSDIKTATAAGSWTAQVAGIQTGAVAQFLKTTSATDIKATLSGSTATAGKIRIFADYVVSE